MCVRTCISHRLLHTNCPKPCIVPYFLACNKPYQNLQACYSPWIFCCVVFLIYKIFFSATKVYIDDVLTCRAWKRDSWSVAKKESDFLHRNGVRCYACTGWTRASRMICCTRPAQPYVYVPCTMATDLCTRLRSCQWSCFDLSQRKIHDFVTGCVVSHLVTSPYTSL